MTYLTEYFLCTGAGPKQIFEKKKYGLPHTSASFVNTSEILGKYLIAVFCGGCTNTN